MQPPSQVITSIKLPAFWFINLPDSCLNSFLSYPLTTNGKKVISLSMQLPIAFATPPVVANNLASFAAFFPMAKLRIVPHQSVLQLIMPQALQKLK